VSDLADQQSVQLSSGSSRTGTAAPGDRAVGLWLLGVCGMIFAMAVIGAVTRLTESGLSIMEWAPISGALPPLSAQEWERLFALYQQTEEYRRINAGMSLAEFREIFWWEWVHRLWGRLIGVVFLAGFLWFLLRGRLRRGLWPHLAALFALGGVQGFVGWYMVESGFAARTDVSQYRLMLHLGMALGIYAYALWLAIGLVAPAPPASIDGLRLRRGLFGLAVLLTVTILAGALVAGLNAGLTYNTFPLMDGRFVPEGYALHSPWVVNWFENVTAVQFNHRLLAEATAVAALSIWLWSRRLRLGAPARRAVDLLAVATLGQVALGVATLLAAVPVWLGALHQAGAITVLSLAIWALSRVAPSRAEHA